ncbi:MAG: hypothetical protein FJ125_13890 [Deltaproteobacteria bacterium]|nr:hypothetical protein [Deltaproteobacteria bacterium]
MRTTLDLADDLLDEAMRVTGAPTKTAAVEMGLRALIEQAARRRLAATGIGWVDAQLLASARVAGVAFWTLDRRLARVAAALGLA